MISIQTNEYLELGTKDHKERYIWCMCSQNAQRVSSRPVFLNRGGTAPQGAFREHWGALEAIFMKGGAFV